MHFCEEAKKWFTSINKIDVVEPYGDRVTDSKYRIESKNFEYSDVRGGRAISMGWREFLSAFSGQYIVVGKKAQHVVPVMTNERLTLRHCDINALRALEDLDADEKFQTYMRMTRSNLLTNILVYVVLLMGIVGILYLRIKVSFESASNLINHLIGLLTLLVTFSSSWGPALGFKTLGETVRGRVQASAVRKELERRGVSDVELLHAALQTKKSQYPFGTQGSSILGGEGVDGGVERMGSLVMQGMTLPEARSLGIFATNRNRLVDVYRRRWATYESAGGAIYVTKWHDPDGVSLFEIERSKNGVIL